jgi:tetratricopeptide (TPR) repeat protein
MGRTQSESTASAFPTRKGTLGNLLRVIDQKELSVILFSWAAILSRKQVVFCALAIALSAVPLCAQKGSPSSASGGSRGSSGGTASGSPRAYYGQPPTQPSEELSMQPPQVIPGRDRLPTPWLVEDERCLPWDLSAVRGATVSVMRLEVPSKARSEYEKACWNMKKRKLSDAEQHVRNAIEKYPNYVAAWVMLGQVLEQQQQTDEGRNACSHALSTDPTYLPPYLCLAEISVRDQQWDEVLNLMDLATGLNRTGDAYVCFFRAMAYYHMHRIAEAEKSALEAADIDREQNEPPVYFLLAQIYEAEGNSDVAAAQIRHFLKLSTDRRESTVAMQYLAKLEGQQATK